MLDKCKYGITHSEANPKVIPINKNHPKNERTNKI